MTSPIDTPLVPSTFLSPQEVIPHRPPFLFLDRVTECEAHHIVGWRLFSSDESFFRGHFPDRPVVPGVILLEGIAQTLAYWALLNHPQHWVLLTGVEHAKFSKVIEPEDEVRYHVQIKKARRGLVIADGVCWRRTERVVTTTIKGFLQDQSVVES